MTTMTRTAWGLDTPTAHLDRQQRDAIHTQHPDWPLCAAGCGWPLDPVLLTAEGWDTHPTCSEPVAVPS